MTDRAAALADLHQRFDGPIEARLRRAALSGVAIRPGDALAEAGRDLDRLALATTRALARLRRQSGSAWPAEAGLLQDALAWYRSQALRARDRSRRLGR